MAALLNQRSLQLNKCKERYIISICRQQLSHSLRAHQHSSDQMKILKDQSAQTTTRASGLAYRLWLPFSINRVLNLTKLRSVIKDQSLHSNYKGVLELKKTYILKIETPSSDDKDSLAIIKAACS